MSASAANSAWRLAFELSPIILTGGVANFIPFSMLPIIAITEAINFPLGILSSGSSDLSLDNFFAHYQPLPGSTIIQQEIGHYPFANQAVAANAVIQTPRAISMLMIVPARPPAGYYAKLPTMLLLQNTLDEHNKSGGTYTIITPSFIYTNCLMRAMRDVSTSQTKQPQNTWQLDFEKPLLTLEDAQTAQTSLNNLMQNITGGTQISGQPALASTAFTNVSSTTPAGTIIPAGQSMTGTTISTQGPLGGGGV